MRRCLAGRPVPALLLQLSHGLGAGATDRLVGADDQATYRVDLVQRPDRHVHDDGRAVRISDDTLVPSDVFGVDLRYDQRHFGIASERGGIADHDRPRGNRGMIELPGDASTGRTENYVNSLEAVFGKLFNRQVFALELQFFACGTRTGQQLEACQRKIALLKNPEKFVTNGAGGAHNRYMLTH